MADPVSPVDSPALDLDAARDLADLCSRAGAVCGKGLLAEVERLRAELADHHCDCLAGKIEEVRADRDRLAARLQAVEALCNEDWHRAMPGYVLVRQVRAALAVPAATEETTP